MAPTRRRFLGTVTTAGAIGLAGCAGDGGTDDSTPTGSTPTQTDGATPTATDSGGSDPATVAVADHPEYGDVLVDGDGRTLYMFDSDTQGAGASTCSGDCAEAWPPLTADGDPEAGDGVSAELTTVERADGTSQVAANGWPLYYFANDAAPGDAAGQGVGDVWWVLAPDGTPKRADAATVAVRTHPEYGDVLVDGAGRTLYMFDNDSRGEGASACYDDCASAWPPLTSELEPRAGDGVAADLGTFERENGARQVTASGWPLYYFAEDAEPGDAAGQGVGDVWWVLAPDGTPKRPASPTVAVRTHPEHGDILVDGSGRTLYMFDSDTQGGSASACSGDCAEAWPPLTAETDPQSGEGVTASLDTFERDDGSRQVTANGWPLYYFANDAEPGDAAGQGVQDVWWVLAPDGAPLRSQDTATEVASGGGGY